MRSTVLVTGVVLLAACVGRTPRDSTADARVRETRPSVPQGGRAAARLDPAVAARVCAAPDSAARADSASRPGGGCALRDQALRADDLVRPPQGPPPAPLPR